MGPEEGAGPELRLVPLPVEQKQPISAVPNGRVRGEDETVEKITDRFKIDRYNGEGDVSTIPEVKDRGTTGEREDGGRVRFGVAFLGLMIAVVNCYAQATFCIAIVEMVVPSDYPIDGKPPVPVNSNSQETRLKQQQDDSCPIEWRYRHFYEPWRLNSILRSKDDIGNVSIGNSRAPGEISDRQQTFRSQQLRLEDRFEWDANRQGLLLGAFAIGTAPLQIVGGRLAELYGAKWVLLAGSVGTCITNLAVPWLARRSFPLLLLDRILMGVAQAGMEPGLMCLLADWLAPSETGFFISMSLFAICSGFFLGSLCSSFLLSFGLGWPATFYLSGAANLVVSLIWLSYASSWPRTSRHISASELSYIYRQQVSHQAANKQHPQTGKQNLNSTLTQTIIANNNNQSQADLKRINQTSISTTTSIQEVTHQPEVIHGAPWSRILTSGPVWAFICCKISVRWCADVLSIELPSYLANVLHLSIELNGLLNSISSALFALFSFLTGYSASKLLVTQQRRLETQINTLSELEIQVSANRAKTRLRKCVQSVASFGSSGLLFAMSHWDCDLVASMSALLLLSCCVVMGTGGELQIPYDMTSRYPGTLHGLACTLSVSGWLAPPLVGLLLGEQPASRYRWRLIWHLTALITLVGGLVFVLFADASPIDFDAPAESPVEAAPSDRKRKCQPDQIDSKQKEMKEKFAELGDQFEVHSMVTIQTGNGRECRRSGSLTSRQNLGGAHWCSMRPLCPRPVESDGFGLHFRKAEDDQQRHQQQWQQQSRFPKRSRSLGRKQDIEQQETSGFEGRRNEIWVGRVSLWASRRRRKLAVNGEAAGVGGRELPVCGTGRSNSDDARPPSQTQRLTAGRADAKRGRQTPERGRLEDGKSIFGFEIAGQQSNQTEQEARKQPRAEEAPKTITHL